MAPLDASVTSALSMRSVRPASQWVMKRPADANHQRARTAVGPTKSIAGCADRQLGPTMGCVNDAFLAGTTATREPRRFVTNEEMTPMGEQPSTHQPVTYDRCAHVEGPFY